MKTTQGHDDNPLGLSRQNRNRRYTKKSLGDTIDEMADYLTGKGFHIVFFIILWCLVLVLLVSFEEKRVDRKIDEARISRKLDVLSGKYNTTSIKTVRIVEEPEGPNGPSRVANKGPN